ncbi:pirin family protein [Gillisia sp. CAL575]|uniref:pirin family protein n=1 Tax=Gillisia sp. CAL575 TaxID=985255 RepID=UPI0003A50B76|nr:pirin family protein [Gillisia sp. CAL575]
MSEVILKDVEYVLPAEKIDMDGFPVKQALPTHKIQQVDPFLLLHHASVKFNKNREARHQGVGPHPHRGFSPVTFIVDGEVRHRDSWGHDQVAKKGEVQWMNAGAGIVHSERPSEDLLQDSARQEIIQLWINSPSSAKMLPPEYTFLSKEAMPLIVSEDKKIETKLIAGTYKDQRGKVTPKSELLVLWVSGKDTGFEQFEIPNDFNCILYLIKGSLFIKGYGIVEAEQLVVYEINGNGIEVTLKQDSQFLLLSGKPIEEKVTQHGPYVMNTQTEVLEAMRDYQMGKMGILIED